MLLCYKLYHMQTPFQFFGFSHLFVIVVMLLGIGILFLLRNSSQKLKLLARIAIVSTLVFQAILFNGWHIYHNTYLIGSYLPFHLCSISLYLVVFSLVFRKNWLSSFTYYVSFVSALLAVISPDVRPDQNFPEFRFIEFFLSHVFIVFGVVFLIFIDRIRLTYRSLWVSFVVLFGYMLLVFPINKITGGNYLFLNSKPGSGGLFAFFPPEPYHVLVLIPATLGIFHLEYGLYKTLIPAAEQRSILRISSKFWRVCSAFIRPKGRGI
jgi:hypothetical integral membrane protein (TIGR02206 family)